MTLFRRVIAAALVCAIATLACAPRARASGTALYPGTVAAGMGGAFRAVADDWSAAFWNPAGLVDLPGSQLAATGTFILPDLTVTPQPLHGYATWPVNQDRQSISFPGLAGFARDPSGRYAYGLGVFASFGLGTTWDLYDLPPGYNDRAQFPRFDTKSDLKVIDLHPAVAARVTDALSAGAGVSINYASLTLRQPRLEMNPLLGTGLDPLILAPFEYLPVDVNVSGSGFGFGGNAGLLWKASDKLRVGVSARAYTDLDISGEGSLTGYFPYSPADSARFAETFHGLILQNQATAADSASAVNYWRGMVASGAYTASTKVPLPLNLGAGLAYQVTPKWLVSADVDWTRWSTFSTDTLKLANRGPAGSSPFGDAVTDVLRELWTNVTRVSLGTRYALGQVNGVNVTALGGYYHDPSPIPDNTLTPLIPDARARNVFQVGGVLGRGHMTFTGVFKVVTGSDRSLASYAFDTTGLPADLAQTYHLTGTPQNVAGLYHLRVYEWVTGLQYTF